MRAYGQYCPVARTAELFAERWSPIIIRNLLAGVTTFGQLQAGAPGIPKAVLTERRGTLRRAGILERRVESARRVTYHRTERGRDLRPLCDAMGAWGRHWLEVEPQHVDPAYVLWATARLVDVDALPPQQVTVRIDLRDVRSGPYWLLLRRPTAEVSPTTPGPFEDLIPETDADALARWHLRELTYPQLLRQHRIRIDGPPDLARALPQLDPTESARAAAQPVTGWGVCGAGQMPVRSDDGTTVTYGPGDVFVMEPGNDAWVDGDEACVLSDTGEAPYARSAGYLRFRGALSLTPARFSACRTVSSSQP